VAEKVSKSASKTTETANSTTESAADEAKKAIEKVTEQVDSSGKRGWSSYIPSVRGSKTQVPTQAGQGKQEEGLQNQKGNRGDERKSWSSYLPSVRSKPKEESDNTNSQSKGWSSYIPSGVGFSSYIPAKGSLSAFAASHNRDPTKSYAEQLYDFSKTPVGAAGLSVATGSGYAGSLYAAYKAYDQVAFDASAPSMEFLSMTHTRVETKHLTPRIGDVLVSNLRAPLLTIVEDTSPGIHDTLMAACDPLRYKELGVEKWEEHGSCAENLVLALKEINERNGLKGRKAIGSDVTVNSVPAPLNLFMNIPWTEEGDLSFNAPQGKRGDYVRLRAERDVVVVMSACPQDVNDINGRKPMVAHFVVDSPSAKDKKKAKEMEEEARRVIEKAQQRIAKGKFSEESAEKYGAISPSSTMQPPAHASGNESSPVKNATKPGRKPPKKLEKRSSVSTGPAAAVKS